MSELVSNASHEIVANTPRLNEHETVVTPNGELLPPPVLTENLNDEIRDGGEISRRTLLYGGAFGALVGIAGYTVYRIDKLFDKIDLSVDLSALEAKPAVVEAAIAPEHYKYEVQPGYFEMVAFAKVGVAVDVKGHKEGAFWGLFGATDADFDKVLFGDFLMANNNASFNTSLKVERLNGVVTGVSATLDPMRVLQERIDFSDFRNSIDINTDDTPEEIEEKIREFNEDGSHYDSQGGFECGGIFCSTGSVELMVAANIVAQYALTIDAYQPDIIADVTERYRTNMIQRLATNYGVAEDKVKVGVVYGEGTDPKNPPTPEEIKEIYKQRMNVSYEETLRENRASQFDELPVLREDDDRNLEVYAKMKGGAELTVKLSGITYSPEIRDLILQNITESGQVQEYDQSILSTLPDYNQPPAPTLPKYNQPPAPTLPKYNQPPAPVTINDD